MSSNNTPRTITVGTATDIGERTRNADAVAVSAIPLGTGAAVVDGIGSSVEVCRAARLAADTAAVVAAHRGAQAGIMAAADTMPDYPGAPNAVAAVVSVEPDGRIEVAHVGDAAVWTWSPTVGLFRWTAAQTVRSHIVHMRTNPGLTTAARKHLAQFADAMDVMDDYVLNGLAYATVSTIAWTPLRSSDAAVPLVLLTSDGVHKPLHNLDIADVIGRHTDDPQALAEALVNNALAVPLADLDEVRDNATAAVIRLD
ncbi:hypothetical protein [Saccharothrix deserti]|uniref:hypothetical protein n=1 Tax=Saccharothrix deserti TaxID=2593674 RepID=UPI00131E5F78|nr:hypothetical protein [Saccharothrix deserti]